MECEALQTTTEEKKPQEISLQKDEEGGKQNELYSDSFK
jgi:hypothetical protein